MSDHYTRCENGGSDRHTISRKHNVHRFVADPQGSNLTDVDIEYDVPTCTLTLSIQTDQGNTIHAVVFVKPEHLPGLVAGLAVSAEVLSNIEAGER